VTWPGSVKLLDCMWCLNALVHCMCKAA
jgi:hypothetical protein